MKQKIVTLQMDVRFKVFPTARRRRRKWTFYLTKINSSFNNYQQIYFKNFELRKAEQKLVFLIRKSVNTQITVNAHCANSISDNNRHKNYFHTSNYYYWRIKWVFIKSCCTISLKNIQHFSKAQCFVHCGVLPG